MPFVNFHARSHERSQRPIDKAGYIHADVNMNLGGPAKVKCKSKSMEL